MEASGTDWPDLIFKSITAALAITAAVAGFFKYWREESQQREADRKTREKETQARQDDLSWKKTQFLFELAQDFAGDERHQHAYQLIDSDDPILNKCLGDSTLTAPQQVARYDIDRYMDFFDRLTTFVNVTKSLMLADVSCFAGYFDGIASNEHVRKYAEENGYQDVIAMNEKLG